MSDLGTIPMPRDFKYRDIFLPGRPQHQKTDSFRSRHPAMPVGKRAKIFAPYDALKGFSDAVAAKNVAYESRRELSEEDRRRLDGQLAELRRRTAGGRRSRADLPPVTVTYFVPCADVFHEAYGSRGQYRTLTAPCLGLDTEVSRTLRLEGAVIRLADILRIEPEDPRESGPSGVSGQDLPDRP